jgi:hypothetical protein
MREKRKHFLIVSEEATLPVSFAMKCTFSTDTPQQTANFYLLSRQQPLDLFCNLFLLKYASRYSFNFASPEDNVSFSRQIKVLTHDWYFFTLDCGNLFAPWLREITSLEMWHSSR